MKCSGLYNSREEGHSDCFSFTFLRGISNAYICTHNICFCGEIKKNNILCTSTLTGPGIAGLKCRDLTQMSPGSAIDVPGF